jgi:hypothetical protein
MKREQRKKEEDDDECIRIAAQIMYNKQYWVLGTYLSTNALVTAEAPTGEGGSIL